MKPSKSIGHGLVKDLFSTYKIWMLTILCIGFITGCATINYNLEEFPQLSFSQNPKDLYGLDVENKKLYRATTPLPTKKYINYKLLPQNKAGVVTIELEKATHFDPKLLTTTINKKPSNLSISCIKDQLYEVNLPPATKDYNVHFYYQLAPLDSISVVVTNTIAKSIYLVPVNIKTINTNTINKELNTLAKKANVSFQLKALPSLYIKDFKELGNPSALREKYSLEMRAIRDEYFNQHPNLNKNLPIVFVVPQFKDSNISEFAVKNKSLGFARYHNLAKNLLRFYLTGPLGGNYVNEEYPDLKKPTNNITANNNGTDLFAYQWKLFQKKYVFTSFTDDYERVNTNNGLIAYYFWENLNNNTIKVLDGQFLPSVQRPFKKNFYSYHLEINNPFFKPLFSIEDYAINSTHLLALIGIVYGWFKLSHMIRRWLKHRFKWSLFFRGFILITQWVATGITLTIAFFGINQMYLYFEVTQGNIKEFSKKKQQEVVSALAENYHPNKINEHEIGSEIIAQHQNEYALTKAKRVMYFLAHTHQQKITKLQYQYSSNYLYEPTHQIHEIAKSHYMVLKEIDEFGKTTYRVYNHSGVEITQKLNLPDPAKRVLLFVNGYRPTSIGNTFEQNIYDIKNNGFEYPNSYNQLFSYDRYYYWQPWKQIDDLFKKRINPYEVFYADGHHSVSTSNYNNLVNFTSTATIYPDRCINPNHHTCYQTKTRKTNFLSSENVKTYDLLPTKPNVDGFNLRRNSGRIAGNNLYQLLNERPNLSKNDTLYIVAHSMGYAYALGMVDILQKQMQLGTFYIIAPENATAGAVNLKNWKNVYQYGSKLNYNQKEAPCLQDGVAPQACIKGLTEKQRVYIPRKNYTEKGFFESHFIGNYTWIFNIPPKEKGHITQH